MLPNKANGCQMRPRSKNTGNREFPYRMAGNQAGYLSGQLAGTDRAYCRHALPLKLFSKTKKQKKKKAILTGRTGQRPKGNGISPEGWCSHYAVSFWSGGAVAVRRTFATFLFFFGTRIQNKSPVFFRGLICCFVKC